MREGESFGLGSSELALFDCITSEHVNIAGTEIEYYQLSLDSMSNNTNGQPLSLRDPLYDEPIKRVYLGPFKIKAYVSYPDHGPTPGIEGFSSNFDATAFVTRRSLEIAGVPAPNESDILGFWDTSFYHKQTSVDGFNIPNAKFYFAVIDVREDGHLFDNADFVGFTLTLKRTTQQTPERKIVNSL